MCRASSTRNSQDNVFNSLRYLFTAKLDQTIDPATEHVLPRSQPVIVCRPQLSCRPTTVNTVTWQQPSPGLWHSSPLKTRSNPGRAMMTTAMTWSLMMTTSATSCWWTRVQLNSWQRHATGNQQTSHRRCTRAVYWTSTPGVWTIAAT